MHFPSILYPKQLKTMVLWPISKIGSETDCGLSLTLKEEDTYRLRSQKKAFEHVVRQWLRFRIFS